MTAMPTDTSSRHDALERVSPTRPLRLQISLSESERALLTQLARAKGHDSVAAYVRAQALGRAGTVHARR